MVVPVALVSSTFPAKDEETCPHEGMIISQVQKFMYLLYTMLSLWLSFVLPYLLLLYNWQKQRSYCSLRASKQLSLIFSISTQYAQTFTTPTLLYPPTSHSHPPVHPIYPKPTPPHSTPSHTSNSPTLLAWTFGSHISKLHFPHL